MKKLALLAGLLLLGFKPIVAQTIDEMLMEANRLYISGSFEEGVALLIQVAGQSNSPDVQEKSADAFYWIREMAEEGNIKAQSALATLYFYGVGNPQNYDEAFAWFSKAAEQGHAKAQYGLGFMYLNIKNEPSAAFDWFLKAAKQGNLDAADNLVLMYNTGQGVELDKEQAVYWQGVIKSLEGK